MHPTPPPDDPKRTATTSRAVLVAPPAPGPVEATAHTVLGLPANPAPEPPPETMDPGLLVTRDSPTGTSTREFSPGAGSDSGETATTAGRRAPARGEDTGLLTGTLFEGKYQVGALLGEGGMGQVYRATHILMRKDVALKVLKPAMSVHSEIVERFRREAESAARLSHPGIIAVLDFGRSLDGTFYLVMEFLEGHSLTRALRDGPMPWRRVCRLGILMLDALAEAHKAGVVHRDLKPDNIMLQVNAAGEESLKLVDFGIAKLVEDGGPQLTAVGLVFGTPSYLSPEQAQGQPVTHSADLYAMGVILFQMLTGRLPFKAGSTMELLAMHIQEPPPRLRDWAPEVPEAIEQLVLRCLGKKPGDRPENALEIRTVLAGALVPEPETPAGEVHEMAALTARVALPPPPPPTTPMERSSGRAGGITPGRVGLGVLAVLGVCALGGLLYFAISSNSSGKSQKPAASDAASPMDADSSMATASPMDDGMRIAVADPADMGNPISDANHRPPGMIHRDRTRLDAALKSGDSARFSSKQKSIRKSVESLSDALTRDPELKKDPALHAHLNASLLGKNHWHRQLTLNLILEHFAQAEPEELKFLLLVINDEKFDTDDRYKLYTFVKSRGLVEGIDEAGYFTQQLRWGTSCERRLEAAEWFKKYGHRGNVSFLKAETAKRSFPLASGVTQSSDCYRAVLQEAVTAAEGRDPGKATP